MNMKSLSVQTLAGGLLFLSGCDVVQNARSDLNRLTTSNPFAARPSQPASTRTAAAAAQKPIPKPAQSTEAAPKQSAKPDPGDKAPPSPVNIIGKSEGELRALLGPPTSVEERSPGKIWRYQEGQCTLDVQLYPDVQTRQFGTLAYEVKSDDNTDEGNRACLVQLQSRAQSHG